jgi:2-(1,2-epoxy-1,2-dihydrophenyl)acetyl-CoA isomerase
MSGYETIIVDRDDGVGSITLNRPQRLNAVNVRMGYELVEALRALEEDHDVRAIVLMGAGRSFCSGDDLSGMETEGYPRATGPDALKNYVFAPYRWTVIVNQMRRLPKPVVGGIRGHAHGAGLNLALACDIRVVSENVDFCVPFVKWAMATGTNQLDYFLPLGIALEMALTGDSIGAERAERLGIANKVVPDERLEEETLAYARRLAQGPTRAIGLSKSAIYKGWGQGLDAAFDYQAAAQTFAGQSEDREEGRKAFAEKRKPNFKGR